MGVVAAEWTQRARMADRERTGAIDAWYDQVQGERERVTRLMVHEFKMMHPAVSIGVNFNEKCCRLG